MKITSFAPGCGGLVSQVQLAQLDESQLQHLRTALAEYGVLFFRDQSLAPEEHLVFAKRFGSIVRNKFFKRLESHDDISIVLKEKDQTTNIGGGWHTDHSYDAEPALGSILVARELPKSGGNTHFAHLGRAYAGLPDALKSQIRDMRAVHANHHIYGKEGLYANTDLAAQLNGIGDTGEAVHPVVVRHPVSGQSILYINPGHTVGFEGQSYEDSLPLMRQLYDHVEQSAYTCSFDWQPGSVAFWDNRLTWHFAQNDYAGERRMMHRITLAGSALDAATF